MSRNKERDEAIVKKVESILKNASFVDCASIIISIARGEVTEIRYNIKEFITPEDEED